MKYTVDFNNGLMLRSNTLLGAKRLALKRSGYTQRNIQIYDDAGNLVASSEWIPGVPEKKSEVLCRFGSFGFYKKWKDYL